jgi:hypothetical protein
MLGPWQRGWFEGVDAGDFGEFGEIRELAGGPGADTPDTDLWGFLAADVGGGECLDELQRGFNGGP